MAIVASSKDAPVEVEKRSADEMVISINAMTKKASSDEVARGLKAEIQALTGSAIAIHQAFEAVRLRLLVTDGKEYRKSDGSLVKKLAPEWTELQKVCKSTELIGLLSLHEYLSCSFRGSPNSFGLLGTQLQILPHISMVSNSTASARVLN